MHLFRTKKALKKELEDWKSKAELNAETLALSARENVQLQERIEKIVKGERCEGTFCKHCKNAIAGDIVELVTSNDRVITFGADRTISALFVPCPDFQRKEELRW